jgi:hypothetical protein
MGDPLSVRLPIGADLLAARPCLLTGSGYEWCSKSKQ